MNTALMTAVAATLADPLVRFDARERPIAYVGFDVPLEVLLASGRPFCHLPWRKGRATPQADRWLESAFPGWARSMLEDWLSGAFDMFERVVFTRGDDAAQRLYYYLCEMQRRGIARGPLPCIFDVAMIRRDASIAHCERAVRALLAEFGVGEQALEVGIGRANLRRIEFARIAAERKAPGHVYENIARAALFRDLTPLLEVAALPLAPRAARRLLLAGSVPPDDMLHRAAESAGWNVVGEAHQLHLLRHGPLLLETGDPVSIVARHCNLHGGGSRQFGDRAAALIEAARNANAAAVILWLTEEDESLAWDLVRQRAALTEAALPHLVLTRRRWDGADGVAETITAFLKELAA